ncbi:hypothetical protein [Neobacillus sp. LXY-1]|uniref:hypothetical protein n=1 Tax=Neobacillus sp. LXY-1 TaxID=3379133 RepID=UPI003EE317D1
MHLGAIRVIRRVIGVLLLAYGIYLIFGTQEFFGTLLIILAFLIFPNAKKRPKSYYSNEADYDESSSGDSPIESSSDFGVWNSSEESNGDRNSD